MFLNQELLAVLGSLHGPIGAHLVRIITGLAIKAMTGSLCSLVAFFILPMLAILTDTILIVPVIFDNVLIHSVACINRGPQSPSAVGSNLVHDARGGNPETMFCRIHVFMWPFGLLVKECGRKAPVWAPATWAMISAFSLPPFLRTERCVGRLQ